MAGILAVVRNVDYRHTYYDLQPSLTNLGELCNRLNLDKRRLALERMVKRCDGLIMEGVEARWVLQFYTERIPDPRSRHAAALKSKDRLRVDKMLEAQGGGSKAAPVAALQAGMSTAVGQPAHAGNHFTHSRSFPSEAAAAAAALPSSKKFLGFLALPSSAMAPAAAPHGTRGGGARGGTSRGGGKKNGKGRALPVGLPTPQAAQARVDYNNQLNSLQQASLPHPNGYHCLGCALGGSGPPPPTP